MAFRPPFGEWSSRLVYVVQNLQLPTVTWDVVSGDPSARTTTDAMIRTVLGKARAGSIIIFHINGRGHKTAEALPAIVSGLRERGFRFLQLSELMASSRAAPALVAPIPLAPLPPAAGDGLPAPPAIAPLPAALLPPRKPARRRNDEGEGRARVRRGRAKTGAMDRRHRAVEGARLPCPAARPLPGAAGARR